MLDDYEVEERENPEIAEDIRVLGAVTYTGEYIRLVFLLRLSSIG